MGLARDDQASIKAKEDIHVPRVKYVCSHGGRILPRPQDDQLRYVGGETRVVAIKRNISYSELMAKLAKVFGPNLWLKYQLPNQDLDSLISVTCDEDVENMMEEYDRNEAREGGLRLRAFLFPDTRSFRRGAAPDSSGDEPKSPEQKYVDAVNGVKSTPLKRQSNSSPTATQQPDGSCFRFDLAKQRHEEGEVISPTYSDSPTSPPMNSFSQVDHARHLRVRMDETMRNPAQVTSAVDSVMLSSAFAQTIREMNRERDEQQRGEQRDEKRSGDGRCCKVQRHVGVEVKSTGGNFSRGMRVPRSAEGSRVGMQQYKQSRPRAYTVPQGAHEWYKAEMKPGQERKPQLAGVDYQATQFAAPLFSFHRHLLPGAGHNPQEAYWQAQRYPEQLLHETASGLASLEAVAFHLHRAPAASPTTTCTRQPAAWTAASFLLDPHPSAPPRRPLPPRYGAPDLPLHEARVLCPTTTQLPSGSPLLSYRNRAGPCAMYELTQGPKRFLTTGIMKQQHPAMKQVYYVVR